MKDFEVGEKAVVASHDDTWTNADRRSIHIGDTVVITDLNGHAVSIRSRKNNRKVFSINPKTLSRR